MSQSKDLSERRARLSPDKKALLEKRLQGRSKDSQVLQSIPHCRRDEYQPLSFAQQRIWFLDQLEPGNTLYTISIAIRIHGNIQIKALEQSLNEIIRHHEALRTTFRLEKGQPVQIILKTLEISLQVLDLTSLPHSQQESEASQQAFQFKKTSFDLSSGPLICARLLKTTKDYILLFAVHHIVFDGWSMKLFFRELSELYNGLIIGNPASLPELPIHYVDYSVWQRNWLTGKNLDNQVDYWLQHLGEKPSKLNLPTDKPRPAAQTFRGATYTFDISKSLSQALQSLSQQEGVTLFMLYLAIFDTLLYRYTGQNKILVGSPIANRTIAEVENVIGFFVNTLALSVDFSGNPSFRELLRRVAETALGAYEHQDLPFDRLVHAINPERDLSHQSLFQVMFVYQPSQLAEFNLTGAEASIFEVHNNQAMFDLTFTIEEQTDSLVGKIEYSTDLFHPATIHRMAGHFQTLASNIVIDSGRPISDLSYLTQFEEHQLLHEWNDTCTTYPNELCVHQLFEHQVDITPNSIAVRYLDQSLTYQELNQQANLLANHLRSLGVGSEIPVGICIQRSIAMIIGLLGILKAGGAYVPLDPSYPDERLNYMISDTGIQVLITQSHIANNLELPLEINIVHLDELGETWTSGVQTPTPSKIAADNLAYIMYTSGSTGLPKGVAITHRNIVRLVKNTNYLKFSTNETFLQLAPLSFDASTLEIWGPLLNGGQLVIYPGHTPTLEELAEAIQMYQITTLWLTAGLFHQMVDAHPESLAMVRQILAGGDILSPAHVTKIIQRLAQGHYMINGYGPTENTTFTCCHIMGSTDQISMSVPIGRPISNTQVYILDKNMHPVPIGIYGELYIGGDGLARGYFNQPTLTAEQFTPNPFSHEPGARLYHSGDVARYLPDSSIEFLGRSDNQVKIRGFRIELGEIEAVLRQYPEIQDVVVHVHTDLPGDKHIVAYLVSIERSPSQDLHKTRELRNYLQIKLPDYMIPAAFIFLEAIPLTPNGKIDRDALPAPDQSNLVVEYVAPRTMLEKHLAHIWAEALNIEKVGINDNFFELGGHSLLATIVLSRIRKAFEINIPLRNLFEYPTIASFADQIETLIWVEKSTNQRNRSSDSDREEIEL